MTPANMPLQQVDIAELSNEVMIAPAITGSTELTVQADSAVANLLKVDPNDISVKNSSLSAIETMGTELQKEASRRSGMLNQSIGVLAKTGDDGGPVANSLVSLCDQVESLDPNKFDFNMGFLRRLLSALPFVGTPIKSYFIRYQSAGSVIDDIVTSLEKGREQLKRDNITLEGDQAHAHEQAQKLIKYIEFITMVDNRLTAHIETEMLADDPRTKFLQEEVLFLVRQRMMDLQQNLAVLQQAVLTIEIIKRNNKELIRGVNRALAVTVTALQTAVTLSMALANQRIVLEKVEAVNTVTNDMIASNAKLLKEQGTAIHKQASSTQLSMESLKQSFKDVNDAMTDIATFRQNALPQMAECILEMNTLNGQADESIRKMKQSEVIEDTFGLNLQLEAAQ